MPKTMSFSRWSGQRRQCPHAMILIWTGVFGYFMFRCFLHSEILQTETVEVETSNLSERFPSGSWDASRAISLNLNQRLITPPITKVDIQEDRSTASFMEEQAINESHSSFYSDRYQKLPVDGESFTMKLVEGNEDLSRSNRDANEKSLPLTSLRDKNSSPKILTLKSMEKLKKTNERVENRKENEDAVSILNEEILVTEAHHYEAFPNRSNMLSTSYSVDLAKNGALPLEKPYIQEVLSIATTQDAGEKNELHNLVSSSGRSSSGRHCATVEEMGAAAVSDSTAASLRVRGMIKAYMAQHGAEHVRSLPREQFCRRKFVFGRAQEDGFGNEMYKILTAAGLGIMLNRSLIIGEHSSTNPAYLGLSGKIRFPFGDYIRYSNETFSMREVKHLWVKHGCSEIYKLPLAMRIDSIVTPSSSRVLCEDWTKWQHPILWFKGAEDAVALQLFLKNVHPAMKVAASRLLGDPSKPSSRPNIFGELMRAFIKPSPLLNEAVDWVLQGVPPDVALHLRMLNSRSHQAIDAASNCIKKIIAALPFRGRKCRVVLVSDTPSAIDDLKAKLAHSAEVIHFNHRHYLHSLMNSSTAIGDQSLQPPRKRIQDWGALPRWVAIVDFFLASRAEYAVVSGAHRRVGTTFAQLLGSLAAADNLDESNTSLSSFHFYSSFQAEILREGLAWQRGGSHLWRTFGGRLSCRNQRDQCALTPLFPYAWWDGPLQSPIPRDVRKLRAFEIQLKETGEVVSEALQGFCLSSRKPKMQILKLQLPTCRQLKICHLSDHNHNPMADIRFISEA